MEVGIGERLTWDQLAPYAVTGAGADGVLFGDLGVQVVLIDGRRVDPTDFQRLAWVHVVVLPAVLLLGAAAVVWWSRRHARPEARPNRRREAGQAG